MSLVSDVPPGLPESPFHSAASEPTSTPDPDDPDSVPEDADEEECLLRDLEHAQAEQTHQERLHPHDQPREITAAPQLLRAALVAGQVQASDSEEDSVKQPLPVSSESDAAVAAEAPVKEPHYHARVRL